MTTTTTTTTTPAPDTTAGATAPLPAPARRAITSLATTALLASLGTSIANVGLPALAKAFHAPMQQVQWVVLAYLLATTALVVVVGRLGDLLGRRRLMLGGLAVFTLASALCALAPTLGWLIAARALQGLGAATMMALSMAMVGTVVPRERTGSAMGWLGTLSATGTALGPALGGLLLAGCGWVGLFQALVPLGTGAAWLAHRSLPADPPAAAKAPGRFDAPGMLVLALTLGAFALAMTPDGGHFGQTHLALLLAALGGLALFVAIERRAASPLVRLALFRQPGLGAGFAMSTLVTAVVMATLVLGPFYLSGALALGTAGVGLVMATGPLVAALCGAPAGRLIDRLGSGPVGLAGLVAMLGGTLALPWLAGRWGVPGYVAALAAITAGYALFQAANNTAVMVGVTADQRGLVSGLLNLSRNLGLITGASLMGSVFALGAAKAGGVAAGPQALALGMQAALALASGLVSVALVIALAGAARRMRTGSAQNPPQPQKGAVAGGATR